MNVRESLSALLQAELTRGFFTAFYVEAGFLDKPEASFTFSNDSKNSLFDLASLTKALVTGPLVFRYFTAEERAQPLHNLGSFPFSPSLLKITPDELLAHRSGLPAWWNFWMPLLNEGPIPSSVLANPRIPEIFQRIYENAEKKDLYSDLGYILLGYFLEQKIGKNLGELFEEFHRSNALGYAPRLQRSKDDFIPSAFCQLRGRILQGEVHDENCAALGGIAGHAGLFGSGPALGNFLRSLFSSAEGRHYLEANHACLKAHSFEGLSGLRRGNGQSAALFCDGKGMGHLGFTGTAFWLDLPSRKYAIFLSNRVISGRVSPHITGLRREVFGYLHDILKA